MWVQKIFYRKGQRANSHCINALKASLWSDKWLWGHLQSFRQIRVCFAHSVSRSGMDYCMLKSCSNGWCCDEPRGSKPAVWITITLMLLFGFSWSRPQADLLILLQRLHRHILNSSSEGAVAVLPQKLRNITLQKSIFLLSLCVSHIFVCTESFLFSVHLFKNEYFILFFEEWSHAARWKKRSRSLGSLGLFHVTIFSQLWV